MASMAMLNNQTVPFADTDSTIWTYEQNPMLWDIPIAETGQTARNKWWCFPVQKWNNQFWLFSPPYPIQK